MKPETVWIEPQPKSGALSSVHTIETATPVAAVAPTTSKRPWRRAVSPTKRGTSAITAMPIGTLMNIVQRQSSRSVRTPPRMRPIAAPPEETAVKAASPRLRAASSGAVVVIRASTLGAASAAPTPWRARAAISIAGETARPPASELATKTPRPTMKKMRRP